MVTTPEGSKSDSATVKLVECNPFQRPLNSPQTLISLLILHLMSAPKPTAVNVSRSNIIQKEEALADEEEDLYHRMTIDKIQFRSSHEVLQNI